MKSWCSCRAHCVVEVARKEGVDLPNIHDSLVAYQIYRASDPELGAINFYDSTENALAELKRLAEEERSKEIAALTENVVTTQSVGVLR